jgi:redox-sensitive bicupin YhaK (pirin superfamily)
MMNTVRHVKRVLKSQAVSEGAGVRLKRAFQHQSAPELDPFLLLDDFHSANPADYKEGFPSHPHRGIETITYVLQGTVAHEDSMGNKGVISSGDIQWMTAGSGIIHQEMPQGEADGRMWGMQLWANLPAAHKMMNPRYQEIKHDQVPLVTLEGGAQVRVIAGTLNGVQGPVRDIVTDPEYLDVTIPADGHFTHTVHAGYTAFAYVLQGSATFEPAQSNGGSAQIISHETLVIYADGEQIEVRTTDEGVRFLLLVGKPIYERVAAYGPIVMNTTQELEEAFQELRVGTFLKHSR